MKLNEEAMLFSGGGFDNTMSPASYNVQGSFPGYVYQILPLNNDLQQKVEHKPEEYYIHPGCLVRGKGFNNPDNTYTGYVNRIVKDSQGAVVCLYIKTVKNNRMVSVRADDDLILLIQKKEENQTPPEMKLDLSYNMNISNQKVVR